MGIDDDGEGSTENDKAQVEMSITLHGARWQSMGVRGSPWQSMWSMAVHGSSPWQPLAAIALHPCHSMTIKCSPLRLAAVHGSLFLNKYAIVIGC